jgi:multisubunit Na+/H+ antiporter MnhE subunit
MKRLLATLVLLWRFISTMMMSAWTTGVIIIVASDAPRRGFVRLNYGDLNKAGVMLLAAMVTLTPGSSTVDIDTDSHELLLHVLDSEDTEATLAHIREKFLLPIRVVFGGQS